MFSPETTHKKDYDKKDANKSKVAAADETKSDLRKAHFNLGHEKE